MTDQEKLELAQDAQILRVWQTEPSYAVFMKHLDRFRQASLARFVNPNTEDRDTHHWRGVYTSTLDVMSLPDNLIRFHRDLTKGDEE